MTHLNPSQCLRVSVDRKVLHVPVEHIHGVVECRRTTSPPFGAPWLSGLAVQAGQVFPCLRLAGSGSAVTEIKAVLLRDAAGSALVEIDELLGFAAIVATGGASEGTFGGPPGWIRVGRDSKGDEALWLDVSEALNSLAG